MKLSASLFALASADICGQCEDHVAAVNEWHNQDNIVCSRYTHPRDYAQFNSRAACKECKIKCVPTDDACPGTSELEAGFWNKTAQKIQEQYIERAAQMQAEKAAEKAEARLARNLTKEMAKYEKIKNKVEEKQAKEENKAWKKADWEAWRQNKRDEANARRAAAKQAKKDAKAAAKAAKEEAKRKRLEKRALADENKVLFAFYADLEEHYDPLCPDMFLIKDNKKLARQYSDWLMLQA